MGRLLGGRGRRERQHLGREQIYSECPPYRVDELGHIYLEGNSVMQTGVVSSDLPPTTEW